MKSEFDDARACLFVIDDRRRRAIFKRFFQSLACLQPGGYRAASDRVRVVTIFARARNFLSIDRLTRANAEAQKPNARGRYDV